MRKLLVILLCLCSFAAMACKCAEPPKLDDAYCKNFKLIFKGFVIKVDECKGGIKKITFKLEELYKGDCTDTIAVFTDCNTDCEIGLSASEDWILYCDFVQIGKPVLGPCTRSRKFLGTRDEETIKMTASGLTFYEEQDFLVKTFGVKNTLKDNHKAELGHKTEKPEGATRFYLLGVSLIALVVILFLMRRFLK